MKTEPLPQAASIERLLAEGKVIEARKLHRQFQDETRKRAQAGEVINLSDLLAANEAFHLKGISSTNKQPKEKPE